ncbi:flagellar protein FliS [Caldicellulosiruptor kronotskyensis 2002]|jgi:flagellar protein FliS|uniref:Flagellar protein FliS n=1 Tax=Caldicellulosiruptor kronotskyensis (strain DSM 18902 / VKM B-2412 / 2002) TaxID=632348 RepID=E4SCK6_CALK2|nr:flagellar export chaperone FliS [Caldicellulosiruptor kronotskyensis]ADQ45940.1 flagellar protein FliS [Caldicellulosiruptor kronotskyensis 2002]
MDAAARYQEEMIMTKPPEELTLMLYDGCIKFIKLAMQAIDEKKFDKANENIIKAENIITELMSTLDMQYEISKNLMSLYDFIYRWLIQANLKKDKKYLQEALEIVQDLRNTWAEAIKIARQQKNK